MREPHRAAVGRASTAAIVLLVLAVLAAVPVARASPYPITRPSVGRSLLSNLTAPSIGPGGSTSIGFRVHDPAGFFSLSHAVLWLEVYALNGYPGDAVGPVPVANAPVLENASASGESVNVTIGASGSVAVNGWYNGSVGVTTSAATPAGTYAVRTALSFEANGTHYLFESRGWFSQSAWESATNGTNGSATLNVSALGVSGVVPETAVYVAPSSWPVALGVLVAIGLVLVGVAAWLYFRKGPGSRSGAETAELPGATNAPRAFGSSRNSPGDSRSS